MCGACGACGSIHLYYKAKRVRSTSPLRFTKSGSCRSEELPQNTIVAPCNTTDRLQQWSVHTNGTISIARNFGRECLQLDSGQSGDCTANRTCNMHAGSWSKWTNNVASAMCDDPTGCCGAREQLWTLTENHTVVNKLSGQCLTLHAEGMHNVGVNPCSVSDGAGLQRWRFVRLLRLAFPRHTATHTAALFAYVPTKYGCLTSFRMLYNNIILCRQQVSRDRPQPANGTRVGRFVSAATLPSGAKSCLARTPDIPAGQTEVFGGPLVGGDHVVLFFNRGMGAPTDIVVNWGDLGIESGAKMRARDPWAQEDVAGTFIDRLEAKAVPVHGVRVFRLSAM